MVGRRRRGEREGGRQRGGQGDLNLIVLIAKHSVRYSVSETPRSAVERDKGGMICFAFSDLVSLRFYQMLSAKVQLSTC